MDYEVQRDHFNKIVKAYMEYVELYKSINNGQVEGISTFQNFYWRFTYYIRYENPQDVTSISN